LAQSPSFQVSGSKLNSAVTSNARRAGIVLVSLGVGLVLFFAALSVVVHVREVLAGAAAGLIPLAIGIGFFVDYNLQKRELSRFGLEIGAESSGVGSER